MGDKSNVKHNILAAALALFSAKGYEGTSVDELVSMAGITKPTLYYYFGSKDGLFDAVCQENYVRLNKVVAENTTYLACPENYHEDIFKTLTNLASAYFSFVAENEMFYRMSMTNLCMPLSSSVYAIVQKYHFEQYETISRMFGEMAKSHGNLIGKDRQLAWSFIGAINAYIGLAWSGVSDIRFNEKVVNELVQQFMHGIYA